MTTVHVGVMLYEVTDQLSLGLDLMTFNPSMRLIEK